MKIYKTIIKFLRKYYKDILEGLILFFGFLGTLLTIFAIQIEESFGHLGQEGVMVYHAVKVPHPNWVRWGVVFIILAFILSMTKFIVAKIGEKR